MGRVLDYGAFSDLKYGEMGSSPLARTATPRRKVSGSPGNRVPRPPRTRAGISHIRDRRDELSKGLAS